MSNQVIRPLVVVPLSLDAPRSEYYEMHQLQQKMQWPRDRFSWRDRARLRGDVHLNYLVDLMIGQGESEIDWDVVVWWNTDMAVAARRWDEKPPSKGWSLQQALNHALPGEELDYGQARALISRIPRTEKRWLDHLSTRSVTSSAR